MPALRTGVLLEADTAGNAHVVRCVGHEAVEAHPQTVIGDPLNQPRINVRGRLAGLRRLRPMLRLRRFTSRYMFGSANQR
ncbi:hypothetical protein GCM10018779_14170 [Streptomyces griseocarneus]|nr:hypothetical protein GCM10018779_14170 [Streptomyces griseocarneus]